MPGLFFTGTEDTLTFNSALSALHFEHEGVQDFVVAGTNGPALLSKHMC